MKRFPVFAVVGRVNKGKSSVIATLAENDHLVISPLPGTTRVNTTYPVVVDGRTLFSLVDTPGFEEAPAALAWLRRGLPDASHRPGHIERFIETYKGTEDYEEECTLLEPIINGAAILYVVDASRPYRDNYRSEMEILSWTGQPALALLNHIGGDDHTASWMPVLKEFFPVVRRFNAHSASFTERLGLLETFRDLHAPWQQPLTDAIAALQDERERRLNDVTDIITELLVESITFTLEQPRPTAASESDSPQGRELETRALEDKFHEGLRKQERKARRAVEALYAHGSVDWKHGEDFDRPIFGEDLFAKRTWTTLGLSPRQLIALMAVSGGIAGGVVDAGVGGASFGTGAALGAGAGAALGAWQIYRRFARTSGGAGSLARALVGRTLMRIGPLSNPNFPFVLLDRAVMHFEAVRTRAHARNAIDTHPRLEESKRATAGMRTDTRRSIHKLCNQLRKKYKDAPRSLREDLRKQVARVLADAEASGS